ncbi:hypothetical protein BJX99DRAFT_256454 [Aspergillus californicus]
MPVSFTFGSLGDIITLSLLVKDIIRTLDSSRGSAAEYAQVIMDLGNLNDILLEIHSLSRTCDNSPEYAVLGGIAKNIGARCQDCLKDFSEKLKRYERLDSSNMASSGSKSLNAMKDSYLKVHWRVKHNDCLEEFRRQVQRHIQAMTAVVATVNLQMNILKDQKSEDRLKEAQRQYHEVDPQLKQIKGVVDNTENLCQGQMVVSNDTCFLSLDTWRKVNAMHEKMPKNMQPWSQAPVILEDVLGRVIPFTEAR